MTALKIPLLTSTTEQVASVELSGNPYVLRVLWNERYRYFALSIYEAEGTPILLNVKLVKNYPVTLKFQDTRLPIGFFTLIQEAGNADRPAYDDLGVTFNLYFEATEEEPLAPQVVPSVQAPLLGTLWDAGGSSWDAGSTLWDQ